MLARSRTGKVGEHQESTFFVFFFFQAEDGIRDLYVTGVQTCALPISSGSRMHANYFRPGGVHQDLPPKLVDDIGAFCDPFLKVVDDLDELLTGNRIFKQRNVDIGLVSLEDCWRWGFSGVMVRGSGAAWDLRKAQPYECYAEMDFDIPVGKNGDNYDRYVIRMIEM